MTSPKNAGDTPSARRIRGKNAVEEAIEMVREDRRSTWDMLAQRHREQRDEPCPEPASARVRTLR